MKRIPVTVTGLASLRAPEPEERWLNYQQRGIGPEEVPDLIRIATGHDQFLPVPNNAAAMAAVHAWRALGQLKAPEAIEPLLELIEHLDEDYDDFLGTEMREVFSMYGPDILPRLTEYLADTSKGVQARWVIADVIGIIGENDPDRWEECLKILTEQLQRSARIDRDPKMTGAVIAALLESEAEETAPLLEHVFATYPVDEEIGGTWKEAQIDLGLLEDDSEEDDWDEDEDEWEDEDDDHWDGPPPGYFPSGPTERVWGDPDARPSTEPPPPPGKTPKERAQERAKARKKEKKKKKK